MSKEEWMSKHNNLDSIRLATSHLRRLSSPSPGLSKAVQLLDREYVQLTTEINSKIKETQKQQEG